MKQKLITVLIFVIILFSSFYFGYTRLSNFSGVDEPYWSYGRVPNLWNAIKTSQWKKTNICDKPGIPIAAISGIGLLSINDNPKNLKSLRYEAKTPKQLQKIQDLYFHLRLPVFLFTLLTLPLFYFLIKQLFNHTIARFATIFIGLSPILLGISLIINADAMLWILTALSTISLFVFFKNKQIKYILLCGFFLGLSVIDKYVANLLFVYFFALFFLEYIFFAHKDTTIEQYLKTTFKNYAFLFITAIFTAFVFFPATWVKFSTLFNATLGNAVFSSTWPLFMGILALLTIDSLLLKNKFSKITFDFLIKYRLFLTKTILALFLFLIGMVMLHVYAGLKIFDLQGIVASPKGIGDGNILQRYLGAMLGDTYSFMFSISPLILLSIIYATWTTFSKKKLTRSSIIIIYIIIFILVFYLGSTVNNVTTTVRYQIMVYPLAMLLAAIGISRFLKIEKVKKYIHPFTAIIIVSGLLIFSLYLIKPNFLAYASEILPKTFIVNLKGMGEGSFEAADYLNKLPNAHELTVWSDKGAVCERFVGRCFIDFKEKTFIDNKIDYFIVSTDRRSRSLKMSGSLKKTINFSKIYSDTNPVYLDIIARNPNDFVKIIKVENNNLPK